MADKVFNADEVTISLGGTLIESGFADGEFLRIQQDTEDFIDVVGTDGEVTVSRTNDRRATITLLLMQTSNANDYLSALNNLARQGPGLAGAVPLFIRDRNGRSLYEADTCWVQKPPDVSFDRGATAREWMLRVGQLRRFDGGNAVA